MLHTCDTYDGHGKYDDDVVQSLLFYIPFIKELCTGLQTLVIEYSYDHHSDRSNAVPIHQATQESLRPFLEKEIM